MLALRAPVVCCGLSLFGGSATLLALRALVVSEEAQPFLRCVLPLFRRKHNPSCAAGSRCLAEAAQPFLRFLKLRAVGAKVATRAEKRRFERPSGENLGFGLVKGATYWSAFCIRVKHCWASLCVNEQPKNAGFAQLQNLRCGLPLFAAGSRCLEEAQPFLRCGLSLFGGSATLACAAGSRCLAEAAQLLLAPLVPPLHRPFSQIILEGSGAHPQDAALALFFFSSLCNKASIRRTT